MTTGTNNNHFQKAYCTSRIILSTFWKFIDLSQQLYKVGAIIMLIFTFEATETQRG